MFSPLIATNNEYQENPNREAMESKFIHKIRVTYILIIIVNNQSRILLLDLGKLAPKEWMPLMVCTQNPSSKKTWGERSLHKFDSMKASKGVWK